MLNRKVKTAIAAVLSCVMGFAMTGCGDKQSTETGAKGEIPTLKYYVQAGNSTEKFAEILDVLNPYVEEKIGCRVEIVSFDGNAWGQKYPLVLSSGEEVDLMFSASWSGYLTQVGQNSFMPLDDLLDKYGQGIKENIQDGYLDAAKVKGKIYGIPANKDIAQGYAIYMDKKILDAAGVKAEDIVTLNDLEPVLAYIKNNTDMTPLPAVLASGKIWLATDESLEEGYMDNSKLETGFDPWDGLIAFDKAKEEFFLISPENSKVFDSAARLMNDWYKKGYFKDGIIAGDDNPRSLWKEGKGWMCTTADTPGYIEQFEKQLNTEVERVVLRHKIKNTDSMIGSLTTIPHASKHPELAMKFINLMFTDEYVINLITYGKEGVHYEKVSDNVVKSIKGASWVNSDGWRFGNKFIQYVNEEQGADYLEKLKEYNDSAMASDIIGFSFDSSVVKNEVAAVGNIFETFKRIFWTGAGDVDKHLKDFFGQLEGAGINKIVDEYNKQYKEWKKTR